MGSGRSDRSPRDICMRRRSGGMKRQVPKLVTDEEAEAFLDSDLSDLDFAQFKSVQFAFTGDAGRPARPAANAAPALRLAPGAPAPRSGVYEQRGPRGGHTGKEAAV